MGLLAFVKDYAPQTEVTFVTDGVKSEAWG